MVQTSCRTRTEEREHESLHHSGKCTGRKAWTRFIRYLRWIFRNVLLESGELLAVLVVEPLDLEVQVHIICALTQAVLLMLWISKRKEKMRKVALQHMTSPIPTTHTETPTLHGVFHILCKHIPHDLGADLAHVQFLGKPVKGRALR